MAKTKFEYKSPVSAENWSETDGRYEIHPYTGDPVLIRYGDAAYRLIAFYNRGWVYPEAVDAYLSDLLSELKLGVDDIVTMGIPSSIPWRDKGYSGNILELRQGADPECLTHGIEGIYVPFAGKRIVKTARALYKAGKKAAKQARKARKRSLSSVGTAR